MIDKESGMGNKKKVVEDKSSSSGFDIVKWSFVLLLLAAGAIANSEYSQVAWAIRTSIGIVVFAVALFVALSTAKGRKAWAFMKSSRTELRKVVWPTRQETIQTTIMVIVMVVIAGLILLAMDSLFVWLVGLLAGQRG